MGSRSKFHKSEQATTPGRLLLQKTGPRKRPHGANFTDAFWAELLDLRQKAKLGTPRTKYPPAPLPRTSRAVRRAEAFMAARQAPRKDRREALQTAREAAVFA